MLIYQYQAESKIVLAVSPVEKIYAPLVCHQSKTIELNEGGRADLTVKNGNNINISNDNLVRTIEDQKKTINQLMIDNANKSKDLGF